MFPSEFLADPALPSGDTAPVVRTIEVHAARTADGGLNWPIACAATWPAC
jgi:hypothetical protein